MRDRLLVPVWMDEWQYACCGDEFAVGDLVSWTLGPADTGFLGPILGAHLPVWSATLPALHTVDGDDGQTVVVAGTGDLVVHLPGADASARQTVGPLAVESHGGVGPGEPPTRGRVQAIQVVSWRHEASPPGSRWTHVPVPDSATVTDVRSVHGAIHCRGFLVRLNVAG